MDFLSVLLAYATIQGVSENIVHKKHEAYCQNLYWQPQGENKMREYGCDIYEIEREIVRVRSGKY